MGCPEWRQIFYNLLEMRLRGGLVKPNKTQLKAGASLLTYTFAEPRPDAREDAYASWITGVVPNGKCDIPAC